MRNLPHPLILLATAPALSTPPPPNAAPAPIEQTLRLSALQRQRWSEIERIVEASRRRWKQYLMTDPKDAHEIRRLLQDLRSAERMMKRTVLTSEQARLYQAIGGPNSSRPDREAAR